jgi:hypothetical protein
VATRISGSILSTAHRKVNKDNASQTVPELCLASSLGWGFDSNLSVLLRFTHKETVLKRLVKERGDTL